MRVFRFIRTGTTLCAGVAASLLAFSSLAADVGGAHVLALGIYKSSGNFVLVKLDKAPALPIACSVNHEWNYTLPLTTDIDKKLFALLVTAQTTGKPVTITGVGSCNEFREAESIDSVVLSS